jgi:hypothetical protein
MHIGDASSGGELVRLNIWGAMTGEKRILLSLYMSLIERELTKARLREEHPEWSEKRVMIEILRLAFLPQPFPDRLQQRFMSECDQYRQESQAG